MSIVVAIGLGLLILLAFGRKDASMIKVCVGVVELGLIAVCVLSYMRKDDIFLQIPGTRIESSTVTEVANTGSFYLDSSQSAYMDNKFFLSDGSRSDLTNWLEGTTKNVYLYISDGNKTLYSKNLGVYSNGMESSIMSMYSSWKSDGVVPSNAIRYWFLCFYFEV